MFHISVYKHILTYKHTKCPNCLKYEYIVKVYVHSCDLRNKRHDHGLFIFRCHGSRKSIQQYQMRLQFVNYAYIITRMYYDHVETYYEEHILNLKNVYHTSLLVIFRTYVGHMSYFLCPLFAQFQNNIMSDFYIRCTRLLGEHNNGQ